MTKRLWSADFADVWFGGVLGHGFGGRRKPAFGLRAARAAPANDDPVYGGSEDPSGDEGETIASGAYGGETYGGDPYGGDGIVAVDRRARRKRNTDLTGR